ncbi:hypothetical protein [Ruegeria sp. HKCCD9179]|uniref:hypothetical protein n=1 Tax=Ruegeria sp. HKCCD9179 TaxID=2683016 RepID=UPI001488BE94|nr:hypothetical protein [Ruegeria sp. HKCCD9179]
MNWANDEAFQTMQDARGDLTEATDAAYFAAAFCDAATIDSGDALGVMLPDPEGATGLAVAFSRGWYGMPEPERVKLFTALRAFTAEQLAALGVDVAALDADE